MPQLQALVTIETLCALVFSVGAIFLVLGGVQRLTKSAWFARLPAWMPRSPLILVVLAVLGVVWLALFVLTIWTAFGALLQIAQGTTGEVSNQATSSAQGAGLGGLGVGALLAALLGAPFLIWTTLIKQKTLSLSETALFNDKVNAALQGLYSRRQITRVITVAGDKKMGPEKRF